MHQGRCTTFDPEQPPAETTAAEPQTKLRKECAGCKMILGVHFYSKNQWKRVSLSRRCKSCTSSYVVKKESEEKKIPKKRMPKRSLPDKSSTPMEKKQKIAPDADEIKKISLAEETVPPAKDINGSKHDKKVQSNNELAVKPKEKVDETTKKKLAAVQMEERKKIMKKRPLSIPFSERKNFYFEWASFPITKSDEQSVGNIIVQRGDFGPIDKHRRSEIAGILETRSQMNPSQALSLRMSLLQQKTMFNHGRLQSQAKHIHKRYEGGESVTALSKKFDFPPCNIFKTILLEMKWHKGKIKKCLRDPRKLLEGREQEEFLAAEAADCVSSINHEDNIEHAELFEDCLASWLDRKGVRYVRQKQLAKEQAKEHGSAVLTPDFLILDVMQINGKRVTWIDCKAYYGANIPFTRKRLVKQMKRYIDIWGDGAVVYLHGFSETLCLEKCSFLDARVIDGDIVSKLDQQINA
mmetsp:Transcript_11387/g.22561  ORF Transcript_11387/g.22561 Transcript_11387/m.22561 type:complete len:466 (-) Transcript_11387:9-1406(-)